jgi:hypothetical protein
MAPVRYWEVQDLWSSSSGLAMFVRQVLLRPHLGLPLLLGTAAMGWALRARDRDVRGGFAWIAAAALPFLLLPGSGERFQYLPSFGACLIVGCAVMAGERRLRARGLRAAAHALSFGVLAISVAAALDRQRDWAIASDWTRDLVSRWGYFREFDAAHAVEFHGVPDDYRSAWVFRNGFPSMVRLYWEGRPYWRAEERVEGSPPAYRVRAERAANGSLSIAPVTWEGRGAELPPPAERPDATAR